MSSPRQLSSAGLTTSASTHEEAKQSTVTLSASLMKDEKMKKVQRFQASCEVQCFQASCEKFENEAATGVSPELCSTHGAAQNHQARQNIDGYRMHIPKVKLCEQMRPGKLFSPETEFVMRVLYVCVDAEINGRKLRLIQSRGGVSRRRACELMPWINNPHSHPVSSSPLPPSAFIVFRASRTRCVVNCFYGQNSCHGSMVRLYYPAEEFQSRIVGPSILFFFLFVMEMS